MALLRVLGKPNMTMRLRPCEMQGVTDQTSQRLICAFVTLWGFKTEPVDGVDRRRPKYRMIAYRVLLLVIRVVVTHVRSLSAV